MRLSLAEWEKSTMLKISLFLGLSLAIGVPLSHAQTLQEGSTCRLGDRAKLFTEATGDAFSVKLKSDAEVTLGQLTDGRWQVTAGKATGYIDAKWLKKICRPQTNAVASQDLELSLDLDEGTKVQPETTESTAAGDAAAPSETTTTNEAADEGSSGAEAEGSTKAPELELGSVEPEPAPTAESTEAPEPTIAEQSTAPSTPAPTTPAETPSVKTVNKPKLSEIVRPEFSLHASFLGEKRVKVVVLDTRVDAVADLGLDGSGMAAIISAELSNLVDGKADIVARSDMATLIQRMEEAQLMGCSEPSCMTNIAALAEADLLVASKVTPAGEGSTLSLELLEAASGKALRREAVTWSGDTKGLVELCAPQVVKLVDAAQGQSFGGAVQLVATEDEAEVYVDEALVGVTPLDIFPNLDIGKHTIRVSKPGYKLFEIPVVVNRDGTSVVQAELIKPWYNEWWVWTAAGAVLTGSITAFVLANQGDDPTIYEVNSAISSGSLGGTSR